MRHAIYSLIKSPLVSFIIGSNPTDRDSAFSPDWLASAGVGPPPSCPERVCAYGNPTQFCDWMHLRGTPMWITAEPRIQRGNPVEASFEVE